MLREQLDRNMKQKDMLSGRMNIFLSWSAIPKMCRANFWIVPYKIR